MCCRPVLPSLSSMGAYLAVDELEAIFGIGNLLAEAYSELGEKVAVFAGGGLSIEVQLGYFTGEHGALLRIEGGDVALRVLDLARDAANLGGGALTRDGGVNLTMIV